MIRTLLIILLFLFSFQIWAQSPYELNWKREIILLGVGASLETFDQLYQANNVSPLSLEELASLDRVSINSFDRRATFNDSQFARAGSDILFFGSFSTPFLFLAGKTTKKEWGKIGLMYFEMLLINTGTNGVTKGITSRIRPLSYNENFSLEDRISEQNRRSFYSGHVALTAGSTFFGAKIFSDYYPDSKWKPYVWTAAALIPAATAYFRVAAGKHYPTDVLTGYVVGGAIGLLIPHLHRSSKKGDWSVSPTGNGIYFSKQF